jgi:hypothetical protein
LKEGSSEGVQSW